MAERKLKREISIVRRKKIKNKNYTPVMLVILNINYLGCVNLKQLRISFFFFIIIIQLILISHFNFYIFVLFERRPFFASLYIEFYEVFFRIINFIIVFNIINWDEWITNYNLYTFVNLKIDLIHFGGKKFNTWKSRSKEDFTKI